MVKQINTPLFSAFPTAIVVENPYLYNKLPDFPVAFQSVRNRDRLIKHQVFEPFARKMTVINRSLRRMRGRCGITDIRHEFITGRENDRFVISTL